MDAQHIVSRRMVIGIPPEGLNPAFEKDFAQFPPAGVILFARDFRDLEDARRLIARLRELARPRRLFVSLDEEGGWVSQLAGHLVVPPNAATLARVADAPTLAWIANVTARRLRAVGFDWDFAPVADVHSEPDNPVIGPRAWGTSPAQVAANVGAWLDGLVGTGLAGCIKHAPGHGDTRTDSHLALPVCDQPEATLATREFVPFAAHPNAASLMTAHVVYPALDPGVPATFSRRIVQGVLRERLGFRGVVITDALEMQGAAAGRTPAEAGLAALSAGCDLLLYAHWNEEVRRGRYAIAEAVTAGSVDRTLFDATRPRLAAFDAAHPEPTPEELATPLTALTPEGWEARLTDLVARALQVTGRAPDGGWRVVEESEWKHGPSFAQSLREAGVPDGGAAASTDVIAIASRVPLTPERIAALRAHAAARPTVLVGLQNDRFLDAVPEAALRVSAADCTPLTRRVVAERLASLRAGSAA
ncbi:MAG: glycoside hydrolase family 3 N-terminal domain-containing protein [bacterium]